MNGAIEHADPGSLAFALIVESMDAAGVPIDSDVPDDCSDATDD